MKKILISVLVIAVAVSVAAVGLSGAWFSEIESTGEGAASPGANYFVAGTIELDDIVGAVTVEDLKPCQTDSGYIDIHVAETSNPGNAWLHFANVIGEENGVTDAEDQAYIDLAAPGIGKMIRNDLERVTIIDLWIDYNQNGIMDGNDHWIIKEAHDYTLADLECLWIPLGSLEPCDWVRIWVSFHIEADAGNEFQSDEVTFDLEVLLQQSGAPAPDNQWPSDMRFLRLENKAGDDWLIEDGDNAVYGTLTFDCSSPTFDYTFEGYGLNDVEYDLIYYADGYPGDNPGFLIDSGTASSGRLSLSGSVDFGYDLPHTSDANHPDGAKIWLVTETDYDETNTKMTLWNPDDYLFETRLIKYDDTG